MSFYDVIDGKVVDYAEVVCCLFEHCNLQCAFCPQDHNSIVGANETDILAKSKKIADWINKNTRSKDFSIHIMGGELFSDKWIDEGFLEIYEKFKDDIASRVIDKDKNIIYNFVSNLVFTKRTEVLYFLSKNDLKLSISYDPHGRFNPAQLEIFKENLEIFRDYIRMVSVVQTKQNIKKIIAGDKTFELLYSRYLVDFDHLLPSTGKKIDLFLMPKESEVLEFYKFLIDNFPKCHNIDHFTNGKSNNKMTCTRGNSFTIMPDGSVPFGCSGSVLLKQYNTPDLGGTKILENFVNKYDCFQCEFFQRCPMTCFIKSDFKHIEEDLDECVFKLAFRYHDKQKT